MTKREQSFEVSNAGLVLVWPFLPPLFRTLLLTEGNGRASVWTAPDASLRAARLLQWLVDGDEDAEESALSLNKLLCGLNPATPLGHKESITPAEQDAISGLLQTVLADWTAIRNSSVTSLRGSFLRRQGRLGVADGHWNLAVQRRTCDVLVDQVPWSFCSIRLPWMSAPLGVCW